MTRRSFFSRFIAVLAGLPVAGRCFENQSVEHRVYVRGRLVGGGCFCSNVEISGRWPTTAKEAASLAGYPDARVEQWSIETTYFEHATIDERVGGL